MAHTHDDDYDEDAIMEDVAAITSASGNEVHLPDTPGRLQDDEDEDLLDESNEFADNLVEELQETDDALLATLHLEREELVSTWRIVVRRMAKKLATLSEANDADTKVKEIDQKIAMVKKLSQSEQPMDEDSTDKAEKKGKNEQLVLKIPPDMPRFDKGSNTRTFLVELRDSITAYVGRDRFERDCQRYLSYAIRSSTHRHQLDEELEARKDEKISWKELEIMFLRIAMPVRERMDEIRKIIGLGRKSNETYRQFALRVHHDVTMLGIKDDNEVIIDSLLDKVPDDVYNTMLLTLRLEKRTRCRFTSIHDFTEILSDMVGPTMDLGAQRPALDDYITARPAPRMNKGASSGANRNRNSGRNRFDPARRQPMQPASATQQAAPRPQGRQQCDNCGPNNTHSTNGCLLCTFCHKRGHTVNVCRARQYSNQANDNGADEPTQATTGENALPMELAALKIIAPDANSHRLASNTQRPTLTRSISAAEQVHKNEQEIESDLEPDLGCDKNKIKLVSPHIENPAIHVRSTTTPKFEPTSTTHETPIPPNAGRLCTLTNSLKLLHDKQQMPSHHTKPFEHIAERNPLINALSDLTEDVDFAKMYKEERLRKADKMPGLPPPQPEPVRISSLKTNGVKQSKYNTQTEPKDNRLILTVNFEGERYDALLDTGATNSCIRKDVALKHGKQIIPVPGIIALADESATIPRIGHTENIQLRYGRCEVFAPFEVIEECYPFVIGIDLFHQLGFSVSGFTNPGDDATQLPEPDDDTRPALIPGVLPPEERTKEFQRKKAIFMAQIQDSLDKNAEILRTSHCPLPEMKVRLPVPEGTVLFRRPRRYAEKQSTIFDEAVEKWLSDDVITLAPVGNVHNNTLTLAAKKDEDGNKTLWRVCLDPRPLNKHIPDDNFPIPLVNDIISRLAGNSIYTTIDLTQAYHRLPIHDEDQPLTAFMHNGTQYMFKKAPFGLKPLSSLFQRGMSRILGDLPFVLNFIDDIVIFSKNRDEHAEHVRTVIKRLTAANLIVNRNKSNFYSTQITLLGFVIGLHGKSVDPKKFANIDEWEAPTTAKQIQSYLGTFNFFREYIPIFSTVTAPLDALRNRSEPFVLNHEQMHAFNTLKELLTHAPILSFPDFDLPFYVATDASDVGIGAVLYQLPRGKQFPKDIRYISFMARSLQQSERKYSATKKELLAIVFALNKFHTYLWGNPFELYTDHRALMFLHSQQDLNPMMTAWQDTILNYNFTIHYRPGIVNILPDALSRLFPAKVNPAHPTPTDRINLAYMQVIQDEETKRTIVPESERQDLLYRTHAMGHIGTNAMVKAIHQQAQTWPHLAHDCSDFIKRCRSCQRNNIVRKGYHPMKAIHARLPGDHIAIDLAGPFTTSQDGNVYLLVIVDVCTRFVLLDALPDKTALTVAKALFKRFSDIGFPRILQSDNGKEFLNGVMKQMTTKLHIDHRLITPYHPRGNGVAENHVKSACGMIRKLVADKADLWDKHIPLIQLSMNTRIVHLHNSSPFSLFFARQANGFSNYMNDTGDVMSQEELLERLTYMTEVVFPAVEEKAKITQAKMIERFNATVLHNEFPDGAKVMTLDPIRGDKLTARYEGPYTVVSKSAHGAYTLRDATGEILGRNYAPSQLKLVLDDLETNAFEVERIVGHKPNEHAPGEYLYHVKWKGYPMEDNTWEPEDSFIERTCIKDYWQEHGQSPTPRRGKRKLPAPPPAPNPKRRR